MAKNTEKGTLGRTGASDAYDLFAGPNRHD